MSQNIVSISLSNDDLAAIRSMLAGLEDKLKAMVELTAAQRVSLLRMGGDQVYADSLWTSVPTLKAWNELDRVDKVKRKATRIMVEQLDRFYCELYCRQWSRPEVATMLARVPSVMMWDDHDIVYG